jgi:hypothetical protein
MGLRPSARVRDTASDRASGRDDDDDGVATAWNEEEEEEEEEEEGWVIL